MTKQFIASEVREMAKTFGSGGIYCVLHAYADRLEEDETASTAEVTQDEPFTGFRDGKRGDLVVDRKALHESPGYKRQIAALDDLRDAQAQAQGGGQQSNPTSPFDWSAHEEAYCVDRDAELEGIFTAGIDIGDWMSRIECHGASKAEAEALRSYVMLSATPQPQTGEPVYQWRWFDTDTEDSRWWECTAVEYEMLALNKTVVRRILYNPPAAASAGEESGR